MAFSNIKNVALGGGLSLIVGDYTNTVGAGSQTYAVGSGRILLAFVNPQVTADPVDARNPYSVSISSAINTVTIYANAAITAGTFVLLVDNG